MPAGTTPRGASSAVPQGRSQLLYWLNGLCNSDYPAVESLRDGAAYCTILEAAINRIAENCRAVSTEDADDASRRALRASTLLARLDWSATSHVCNDVDPSLDSIMVSASCRRNMEVLMEMTMHCTPPEHARSIEVERMARGRFQDHVQFLQWLYQFMTKVLSTYSKAALQEAMSSPTGVAGVKMNRTVRMRQQSASARTSSNGRVAARSREKRLGRASSQDRPSASFHDAPWRAEGSTVGDSGDDMVVDNDETNQPRPPNTTTVRRHVSHHVASEITAGNVTPPSTAAPVFWDRGAVTVPASEKTVLLDLRRSVEQLEALVLYACDAYQQSLTRSALQAAVPPPTPSALVRACLEKEPALAPPRTPTVSLADLGRLLDERDEMSQLYERVRLLLTQYERQYSSSPLLRELQSLFQPEQSAQLSSIH